MVCYCHQRAQAAHVGDVAVECVISVEVDAEMVRTRAHVCNTRAALDLMMLLTPEVVDVFQSPS